MIRAAAWHFADAIRVANADAMATGRRMRVTLAVKTASGLTLWTVEEVDA